MKARDLLYLHIVHEFELYDIDTKTRVALEWWLFDAMGGTKLDDLGWWDVLDAWLQSVTEWKSQAAGSFLAKLMAIVDEQLRAFDKRRPGAMRRMIGGLQRETRFKVENYNHFVESLQHTIWVRLPVICFIGGHASGDMYGIGASALIKKDLGIVVYQFKDKGQDHSAGMKAFFDLVAKNRAKLATSDKDCLDNKSPNSVYKLMDEMKCFCWLAGYNMGTYFLMDKFDSKEAKNNRDIVREGFGVRAGLELRVEQFLELKTLPLVELCKRKVLVLWSRFTGKKGEYHPEHDTSFTGVAQLAWLATELGYYVIITGDKPVMHSKVDDRERHATQFDSICNAVMHRFGEKRCFNLTEFWTEKAWTGIGPTRLTQYQVFELLHRTCDVRHLGMRSGNLEALALLSYFVRYMEEGYSWGGKRMMAWHGRGIGYERILLKEPPTRVGKYLHYNQKLNRNGLNKAGVSKAFVPSYIRERNRGIAGTSTKDAETLDQEFARKQLRIQTQLAQAPVGVRNAKLNDLVPQRAQEETKREKPLAVARWHTGFDFNDLMKIVLFLREPNPTCMHKVPFDVRTIWPHTPDLPQMVTHLQVLSEMRSLLVNMGLVRAVSRTG